MKFFSILLSILVAVTACHSKREFISRKYMPGYYVSYAKHKKRAAKSAKQEEKLQAVYQADKKETVPARGSISSDLVEVKPGSSFVKVSKPVEGRIIKEWAKQGKSLIFQTSNKKSTRKSELINGCHRWPSKKNSIAHIASGSDLILDALGLFIVLTILAYLFASSTFIGLLLGVVTLGLGILSLRKYRTEKVQGSKNTGILALGIIGIVVGCAAIFLWAFYSFFGILVFGS